MLLYLRMNPELNKYITQAKAKGLDDERIKAQLIEAGWTLNDIDVALGGDILSVPKPNQTLVQNNDYKHMSHPLNSVGYIICLVFSLLSIFSISYIFVTAINFYMPEQVNTSSGLISTDSLSLFLDILASALATVVVTMPIYLVITYFLRKYEVKYTPVRKSYSRKILLFVVTLITFWTMVGYGMWFLYNLFLGDFSFNKLLVLFSIIFVNAIPFGFYFVQLKNDRQIK
jgi:hypothetical protein